MKHKLKTWLALLLALALLLGNLPAAQAAQTEAGPEASALNATGLLPVFPHGGKLPEMDAAAQSQPQDDEDPLPESYDSRDYGYITAVKNQGRYNTCWAFSAAACCEAYMIKHGIEVGTTGQLADQSLNLSEFHLAFFAYTAAYDAEGMLTGDRTDFLSSANTNFLDFGGTGELASYPLMRWTGLAAESEPALMYSSANYGGLSADYAYEYNVGHVQSARHYFGSEINQIKRDIMEYGAGSMGVRVSNQSGTGYHGGVNTSNGTICWIQPNEPYTTAAFYYADHDVTVVGWDDTFPKEMFNSGYRPKADGAWIVKNSWGVNQGDEGYFYISYEDSSTRASYISFYAVEGVDNYDHNYQYDGSGNYCNWEELTSGDAIAQQFVASGNETLEAVAIGLCGDDTHYTLNIYTDCTTEDPTAGTLAHTQSGLVDYWGYQTVRLTSPVILHPGQRFAVVFEFSGPEALPLYDTSASENQYYNMQLTHQPHPNTAYLKHAADAAWQNMSGDRNYRVKAFTKEIPEDPVPMTLSCYALGELYTTVSGTAGDRITLPAMAPSADGWSFQGWVTAPLDETTEKPDFYKPGASMKLTASVPAVYALYLRAEPINAPVTYELVQALPDTWIGKYVLLAMPNSNSKEYAMHGVSVGSADFVNVENTSDGAATPFESTGITRSGNTLRNVPETYVFEVASTDYGLSLRSVAAGSYLASYQTGNTGTSYALYALKAFDGSNSTWTFELDDGDFYLKNNNSGLVPYVAVSSAFGFCMTRYGSEFKFYKQNPTEIFYYATNLGSGGHVHSLTYVAPKAPTCGEDGNIAYWYCAGCGKYFSDANAANEISQADTVRPATGAHTWGNWQVERAPTCTEAGLEYRLCQRCTARDERGIDALGHDFGEPTRENETAPTCTEPGGYDLVVRCTRCGEMSSFEAVVIVPLGHSWDDGVVIKEPTEEETGEKRYTCTVCGATTTETLPVLPPFRFEDVTNPEQYFFVPVYWAYNHKPQITSGIDATHFGPKKTCTRAQVVTFLWSAFGRPEPEDGENPFEDVKQSDYYYKAVLWACQNGITGGVDSTHFQPKGPCTRAQVVTFLWSAKNKPEPTASETGFVDVSPEKYYYKAVLWAAEVGVTGGTDPTHFSPKMTCTRAQVVTFLYGLFGK